MMTKQTKPLEDIHRSQRAPWLRAAVLGANDGIVSTAGLVVGVATANADELAILTAGIAGLVAGALSMAAGEYVSVSSQRDSERADIDLETRLIAADGAGKRAQLADIYVRRGLNKDLAVQVAKQLHEHDAVAAHARDELGIDHESLSNPWQAALSSATSFTIGAMLPVLAAVIWHGRYGVWAIVAVALVALAISGAIGALIGGGNRVRAALRVLIGGGLAMLITGIIGHFVGQGL